MIYVKIEDLYIKKDNFFQKNANNCYVKLSFACFLKLLLAVTVDILSYMIQCFSAEIFSASDYMSAFLVIKTIKSER